MRYLVSFIFVLISSLDYLILASEKPNIIVIMADDLGYESLSANGSEPAAHRIWISWLPEVSVLPIVFPIQFVLRLVLRS